jgi:arylsulfatase A-like enzyme
MVRQTPSGTVRVGDWKLLEYFEDHRLELYHLRNDLSETTNLAASVAEVVDKKRVHAKMQSR